VIGSTSRCFGSVIIGAGFVGVVGTDIARSRTSEVSFRSVDAGRMLDQSRWHRHCPGFRARRGPFVGSGRSAGAFGWSLRPMLGEGVPLSGPIRGQKRPRPASVCACDLRGVLRRPSGRADRPLWDRSSGDPATHDKAMPSLIILVCVTLEGYPGTMRQTCVLAGRSRQTHRVGLD
jgi:hypothetical protein